MGKVYVVQNHLQLDYRRGGLVPRYNISSAARYGSFVFVTNPTASTENPEQLIERMNIVLRDFGDEDYLLLIGNPALIGWVIAIAAAYNGGRHKMLVWDHVIRGYKVVEACIPVIHRDLMGNMK